MPGHIRSPRGSIWRKEPGLVLVLILYLVLAMVYSVTTPIFEASDELWHYPFVKHLADGGGLPVQHPDQIGPWRQEGSQPPLYYFLGALVTGWIDTSDMDTVRRINPHADMGVLTRDRNVNMVIHTEREAFPYRGTALAVHIVRWMSVLMGAVTVLAAYFLARELCPGDKIVALSTACLTAFNPMFLFITSSVNNDALVIMLSALCIWLIAKYVAGSPSHVEWALLGVLLGLASLAKTSALGMLPLAALAVVVIARRHRPWRYLLVTGLLIGLPVALIGGWWYYRNWRLYHDPLGFSAFVAIIGARYPVPTLRQLLGEWKGFVMSYWGFFGGVNLAAPDGVYLILSAFGLLGLVGAPVHIWRTYRAQKPPWREWAQLALITLWPCILFASLIRWTMMTPASQGRLLFPGLTALSLLMAMGLAGMVHGRYRALLPGAMAAIMLVSAAALPFVTIRPAYALPPLLGEEEITGISHRLDVTFEDKIRLLGYDLDVEEAIPGDEVALTLYWEGRGYTAQALAPMREDYSVFVHLLGASDLIIGQRDVYPGQGNYATSAWEPGVRFADTYVVRVSPTAMTPCVAAFEVGLYRWETGVRLSASDENGLIGNSVRLGRIEVPKRIIGGIPNPVHFRFEDDVALVGYDLDRAAARPGEAFHLVLYWQALGDVEANYAVFTQVVGDQGAIWAQMDGWPQQGDAPTATWRKGQVVRDPYTLIVKEGAPPGVYDLHVGMYDSRGERLAVLGKEGYVQGAQIAFGKVRVLPVE
jgi:4-amino-4-deoxy-L-arabinose transferase-like glycosyltransferase